MSEMGDAWRQERERGRDKRLRNRVWSTEKMQDWCDRNGVELQRLNDEIHLRIEEFDFWPSTGQYLHRPTGRYARGVQELIRELDAMMARRAGVAR